MLIFLQIFFFLKSKKCSRNNKSKTATNKNPRQSIHTNHQKTPKFFPEIFFISLLPALNQILRDSISVIHRYHRRQRHKRIVDS